MRFDKLIPNFITLLNLFSGIMAMLFALLGDMSLCFMFVVIGLVFDFLDGFIARLLNARSHIGKELDSLADLITFGLVPGIVMFHLIYWSESSAKFGYGFFHFYLENATEENGFDILLKLPMLGFIITLASAYRLARFNADNRQTNYFLGLATPGNAIFILSLPMIIDEYGRDFLGGLLLNTPFLIFITFFSAFLMNAPIRLFSLKTTRYGFKDNYLRYIFVLTAVFGFFTFGYLIIPLSLVLYFLLSRLFAFQLGLKELDEILS